MNRSLATVLMALVLTLFSATASAAPGMPSAGGSFVPSGPTNGSNANHDAHHDGDVAAHAPPPPASPPPAAQAQQHHDGPPAQLRSLPQQPTVQAYKTGVISKTAGVIANVRERFSDWRAARAMNKGFALQQRAEIAANGGHEDLAARLTARANGMYDKANGIALRGAAAADRIRTAPGNALVAFQDRIANAKSAAGARFRAIGQAVFNPLASGFAWLAGGHYEKPLPAHYTENHTSVRVMIDPASGKPVLLRVNEGQTVFVTKRGRELAADVAAQQQEHQQQQQQQQH